MMRSLQRRQQLQQFRERIDHCIRPRLLRELHRMLLLRRPEDDVAADSRSLGPWNISLDVVRHGDAVRQINAQLKDDSDWQLSENYFNTIYDGLLDRLRANYPSLSQTDLRLCVYIKLNLSTKETAELMNISPRSVEMARYRLRKKLGLGSNDNIGSVLR